MKDESEDIDKWWNIFKFFPPEPRHFWRLYMISLCVTLILFLLAALSAWHTHDYWSKEPEIRCKAFYCPDQNDFLMQLDKEKKENLKAAKERKKRLERIRWEGKDKYFMQPWSWFESEIEKLEKFIKKSEKPLIQPISKSFPKLFLFILFSLMIYILIERLVILHAKWIPKNFASEVLCQDKVKNDIWPHIIFGFLISFCMITAEIFTSVLAKEKTWFGWDSFCVTPSAFVIKCFAHISFGLVAAAPFTMLWYLSAKRNLPDPDPLAEDGKFGAGRYVQFLQTWTLWLILAPSTLGIIWIRYVIEMEPQFSPARLLHGAGVGVLITIIVYRLIRNAIILRFKCEKKLQEKKSKAQDKPPTDPTIAFIGSEWWKLPATVTTTLAVIWGLLEGLDLTRHILDLIR